MAGIHGASAYSQSSYTIKTRNMGTDRTGGRSAAKIEQDQPAHDSTMVEAKSWSPIDPKSSLVPRTTEYGNTIGDVQLSDKAKAYYDTLKSGYYTAMRQTGL